MARAATLSRLRWQDATISDVRPESRTGTTLRLDVADWPGHRAGQHVDIRLTALGGYTAVRPYSLASAGGSSLVEITVEVVVEAGPAFGGSAVELPYFVAVTAPGGRVLDRRDFTARVVVPAGGRRAGTAESFSQRFVGVGRQGAAGYQILFGFPLPREEALRRREEG